MKKIQELHDAETHEGTKQRKELELENEELKHRLAKMDMNLTQLQCENKVNMLLVFTIAIRATMSNLYGELFPFLKLTIFLK